MIITQSGLIKDFRKVGLQSGDTVMLHVSIKSIGWLVGGPSIVLTALIKVLGISGTIIMYCGWEDSPYALKKWGKAKREKYLKECPVFDPRTSRAVVSWSILAEILRTWPGTIRSKHPDGSFCAIGAKAHFLTKNHPLQYGYGIGSPLHRLIELGGKIINIGAPLNTTTLLHYAEDRAKVRDKKIVCYSMPILHESGQTKWIEIEEFDTSKGIVDWYEGDYFEDLMSEYIAAQRINPQKIGLARSYLFPAKELNSFAQTWMEKNLNR